jgi:hypothetical protein
LHGAKIISVLSVLSVGHKKTYDDNNSPTEMTEMTERLCMVQSKISVLSVLSVGHNPKFRVVKKTFYF